MKECFCFLFGLICGAFGMFYIHALILRNKSGRLALLRSLHQSNPEEYHAICALDPEEILEKICEILKP